MGTESISETGFIKRLREKIRPNSPEVAAGIGDDAAVIRTGGGGLLLAASDMLIENVHFTAGMSFARIGRKAVAVNLSDIAAMGGTPRYCLVSLGIPRSMNELQLDELYGGITGAASAYGVDIIGGDTNLSPAGLIVDVCILGEGREETLCLRSGARTGDAVMVTGELGRAAMNLKTGGYTPPVPRVKEAGAILEICRPTSMIDISDGLAKDLRSVCESSGCGAKIFYDLIPAAENAPPEMALSGGEDYELLFTVSPGDADRLESCAGDKIGIRISRIGIITEKNSGVLLVDENRKTRPLEGGYEHF